MRKLQHLIVIMSLNNEGSIMEQIVTIIAAGDTTHILHYED